MTPLPPAKTKKPWHQNTNIQFLLLLCICIPAIHIGLNSNTEYHASPKNLSDRKLQDFQILYRRIYLENPPLEKTDIGAWLQARVTDGGEDIRLAPGSGTVKGNDWEKIDYRAEPDGSGVQVTLHNQNEYNVMETVYRVGPEGLTPLSSRTIWPLGWAIMLGFFSSLGLLIPWAIVNWAWQKLKA